MFEAVQFYIEKFSGAPKEKNLAKYLKYHFLLSYIVSELFKGAYLCKPIQIGLFGVLSQTLRWQKIVGNTIPSAEFSSCWWLSENAS